MRAEARDQSAARSLSDIALLALRDSSHINARQAPWLACTLGALLLVTVLSLASGSSAQAQPELVEDSWARAEAQMQADPAPDRAAYEAPQGAFAPHSPWLGAGAMGPGHRRARRAARRAARAAARQQRELNVARLRLESARVTTPTGGPLRLQLRGAGRLDWVWLGADGDPALFSRAPSLCVGACVLHLAPGSYRFGIRGPQLHGAVAAPVEVSGPGVLTAHYQGRRAWLHGGVALMVLGGVTVFGFMLRALINRAVHCGWYDDEGGCESPTPLEVALGLPIGFALFFGGLTFVLTSHRRVEVSFRPNPRL